MYIDDLFKVCQEYFPKVKIGYKDQNFGMKILSLILFFNPKFSSHFTTTVGSTIYFPNLEYVRDERKLENTLITLHELVHITDASKISSLLFMFLYLLPISLIILFLPMLFIFSWWLLILIGICLLPLPAYFRMYFERRAYFGTMYVLNKLGNKWGFDPHLEINKQSYMKEFNTANYYWMWIFNLEQDFQQAQNKIQQGQKPFEGEIFDTLDKIIDKL